MFLKLYQVLQGYVRLEVSGFSVERFMNMVAFRNIHMWQVEKKAAKVYMNVSVKGFKELVEPAKIANCKLKIVKRRGLPFFLFTYRKRKFMALGAIIFMMSLYMLTNFVWLVEVAGNERLKSHEILEFVETLGLHRGVWKHGIDRSFIERNILYAYGDINFLHIEIKGTKAVIHLAENITEKELISFDDPTHVVAKKDGLITMVATSAGTPMVKKGDVVRKGDMLISGILDVGIPHDTEMSKDYVRAYGEVYGKIYYEVELEIPFNHIEKIYTGKKETYKVIQVFGKEFSLLKPSIKYEKYDRLIDRFRPHFGKNYPLPMEISTIEFREFTERKNKRSLEAAKTYGERAMTEQIIREYGKDLSIIDSTIEFIEKEECLLVRSIFATIERIDEPESFIKPLGAEKDAFESEEIVE